MTGLRKKGLSRLVNDLGDVAAPAGLQTRILQRITSEPARVETDRKGAIVSINPAFTRLCGYSFSEIKGLKPGRILQGADSEPKAVTALRQAVRKGAACTVEMINYHKDGSTYRVRIAIEPIRNGKTELTGFRAMETRLPPA